MTKSKETSKVNFEEILDYFMKSRGPKDTKQINKNNKDYEEILHYLAFWNWEYARRKLHAQRDIQNIIDNPRNSNEQMQAVVKDKDGNFYLDPPEDTQVIKHEGFIGDYVIHFMNHDYSNTFYYNSEAILKNIVNKTFKYIYPTKLSRRSNYNSIRNLTILKQSYYDLLRAQSGVHFEEDKEFMDNIISNNHLVDAIVIDYSQPIDVIMREIKDWYAITNYSRCDIFDKECRGKFSKMQQEQRLRELNTKLLKLKISNESRAVGLWIYDHCHNNHCGGNTAFKELRTTEYLEKLKQKNSDQYLKKLYRIAKKCIDAGELLQIS